VWKGSSRLGERDPKTNIEVAGCERSQGGKWQGAVVAKHGNRTQTQTGKAESRLKQEDHGRAIFHEIVL